jgi:hypothetical protein
MILVALSLFIFPALIIASCYTLIVVTIWKKSKIMQPPLCTSAILPRGNIRIIPSINQVHNSEIYSVPLTEARRQRIALEDAETRRASSRGLIPKAKVKTIKMTFVIISGEEILLLFSLFDISYHLFQYLFCAGHHTLCLTYCRYLLNKRVYVM